MKVTIDSLYDDGLTLFSDNVLLNSDDRLSNIMEFKNDLDLIASENYGAREFLTRMVKHDDVDVYKYNISKINRHIYSCMIENLPKYTALLSVDARVNEPFENEYYD